MSQTSTRKLSPSSPSVADIASRAELSVLCEVHDGETDEFLRSTFVYIDRNDGARFGQARGIRKYDLTIHDLRSLLQKVPDHKIYPPAKASISRVVDPKERDYSIKRPKLICSDNDEENELIPQIIPDEAEVLEKIKWAYHPSLVRYYGCIINDGRITGFALERLKIILQYRYEDDAREFDVEVCLERIQSGSSHLHLLGFAHNDINPMNIALDKDDQPVILDFSSCKRMGEKLLSARTPGLIDEADDLTISLAEHDVAASRRFRSWLYEQDEEHRRPVLGGL